MTEIEGGAIVLMPGESKRVDVGGFNVAYLATRQTTSGAYSLIETGETETNEGPPLHTHRDAAESFYVITGAYAMHVNGRDFHCLAGSFIYVPRNIPHTFRVLEPDSRKLNLYTPAAMEGYFEDLGRAIVSGVDEAGLREIADRYEMEVLGPPPADYLTPRG